MNSHIASAVFPSNAAAASAITELRALNLPDAAFSVLTPRPDSESEPETDGRNSLLRLFGGGAIGAGLGVVALAVPGVGPLAAAGAIAAAATPAFASAGAAVGALAALLAPFGVEQDVSDAHEREMRAGGVLLLVDAQVAAVSVEDVQQVLDKHGGRGRATDMRSGPLTDA